MNTFLKLSLMLVLAGLATAGRADELSTAGKEELARLRGTWIVEHTIRNGQKEPPPAEPLIVTVDDDRILLGEREVGLRITLLAPDTNPKLIDIVQVENKTRLEGVYQLQDDQWQVCLNGDNGQAAERPTGFDTTLSTRFVLVVLKREKR